MATKKTDDDPIKQLAQDFGIKLVSGAAQLLAPNPVAGLVVSSAINSALVNLWKDFKQRQLSDMEQERVDKLVLYGADKFQRNLSQDKKPADIDDTTAKEVVEALLTSARREHEDRKIRYLGNLLGNLGFHSEVNPAQANLLIKCANELSYTQLVLLQVFSDLSIKEMLPDRDYRQKQNVPWPVITVLQETKMLFNEGLVNIPNDTMLGLTDLNPYKMQTQGQGKMLQILMELDTLPQSDILSTVHLLSQETA